MYEISILEIVVVILLIFNIIGMIVWIWGIIYIENCVRNDLKRYSKEISLDQVEKAMKFVAELKTEMKKK